MEDDKLPGNKRVLFCFVFFTVFSFARGGLSSSMVHVIQIPFIWKVTVVKQRDEGVVDAALKNGYDSL